MRLRKKPGHGMRELLNEDTAAGGAAWAVSWGILMDAHYSCDRVSVASGSGLEIYPLALREYGFPKLYDRASGTITEDLLENEVAEVGITKGKYLLVNIYSCSQRRHRRKSTETCG